MDKAAKQPEELDEFLLRIVPSYHSNAVISHHRLIILRPFMGLGDYSMSIFSRVKSHHPINPNNPPEFEDIF